MCGSFRIKIKLHKFGLKRGIFFHNKKQNKINEIIVCTELYRQRARVPSYFNMIHYCNLIGIKYQSHKYPIRFLITEFPSS